MIMQMQGSHEPKILSLPAKRDGLFAPAASLIARSDSNGEDLEGFAGAGGPTLCEWLDASR